MQCPVYIDVCNDLIPGVACRFCYRPCGRRYCALSSSIAVADGRVLVVCHVSRSLLIIVAEGRDV